MDKISVAGLGITPIRKTEILKLIENRIKGGQKTFITTPYSEFLFAALSDREILDILNQADIAVADGVGILWAAKFLQLPLTAKSYYGKLIQSFWQTFYTLVFILIKPSYVRSVLPEKISGSDLIFDLAALAAKNNWSVYFLGGHNNTPELAAAKLKTYILTTYNLQLSIAGTSSKNPADSTILDDINRVAPDMIFVAYGPIKQERWITRNLPNLPIKMAIGLGGTFDYLAGKVLNPPQILRQAGLEWLFRLLTQPHRTHRIYNAFFGLISSVIKYKIFTALPYRKNTVCVVINKEKEIFIARSNPEKKVIQALGHNKDLYKNYWQLPQGGIEPEENIEDGASRELKEETSINNASHIFTSPQTYAYQWRNLTGRPLFAASRFRYIGQRQHLVYFKFNGNNNEIHLDPDELIEYKWVTIENLPAEVNSEKKALAELVLADLKNMSEKGII